jgi:Na+/melibiose symporter-like transporter
MKMLRPFRRRDFALLWTGMAVSFLGDGIYLVAIAFQAYELSDRPSGLALVGAAWSAGMVGFLLVGGILADRLPRRRMLIAADLLRLVALVAMGGLALSGHLTLWEMALLACLYGMGEGLFMPAFEAIIPDIVDEDEIVAANAVRQSVQPLTMQFLGPALGGALVATAGAPTGLLIDAATFGFSLLCVVLLRVSRRTEVRVETSARRDLTEALRFVRATPWLWATMCAVAVAVLVFAGPVEALLPFRIKNELGGDAGDLGLILAAAGLGAIAGSLWRGQRDLPERPVRTMYLCWSIGLLPIAAYALLSVQWQLMLVAFAFGLAQALGDVIWGVLMQTRVPAELRGRVSSLDWFVSLGLFPVSFLLVAPVTATIGVDATLIGAGIGGSVIVATILLLVPDLRDKAVADDAEASHPGPFAEAHERR